MANEKKTSRSFELGKGEKRSFELDKKQTRAFDLTKDVDEAPDSPVANAPKPTQRKSQPTGTSTPQETTDKRPTPTAPSGTGDGGNKKKWLWIVLAIIVLAILAYLYIPNRTTETQAEEGPTEMTMNDGSANAPHDSRSVDSTTSTTNANPIESPSARENAVNESNMQTPSANNPSETNQSENADNYPVSMSTSTDVPAGSIEEEAQKVIKGVYGNNPERRQKLGADYKAIQRRVNELMRK